MVNIQSTRVKRGKKTITAVSSGGVVVWRGRMLLLLRKDENIWGMPKGHLEKGETELDAALREIEEESGMRNLKNLGKAGTINYSFFSPREDMNQKKRVVYFLFESNSADVVLEKTFSDYCWVDMPMAIQMVYYDNDRAIIKKAYNIYYTLQKKSTG